MSMWRSTLTCLLSIVLVTSSLAITPLACAADGAAATSLASMPRPLETGGDDILDLIAPIIAHNTGIRAIPLFSKHNKGVLRVITPNNDQYDVLAHKDANGTPTRVDSIIYTLTDTPSDGMNATVVVEFNEQQLPVRYNLMEYGVIELEYVEGAGDTRGGDFVQDYILNNIAVHIIDEDALTTKGTLLKLIPCSGMKACVPIIQEKKPKRKHGYVTLESSTYFDPVANSISVHSSSLLPYHDFISPIETPTLRSGVYSSRNRYSFDVIPIITESEYVSLCGKKFRCVLESVNCAFEIEAMIGNKIQEIIQSKINTLPVDSLLVDALETIKYVVNNRKKLSKAHLALSAVNIASQVAGRGLDFYCKKQFEDKLRTPLRGSVHATSYGPLPGTAVAKNIDIQNTYSLPNLTISKLSCTDSTYVSGADQGVTKYIDVGSNEGSIPFMYETYRIRDRITVFHGSEMIYDSGCVGEQRNMQLSLRPDVTRSSTIRVTVEPNCAGTTGTLWNFRIGCAGAGSDSLGPVVRDDCMIEGVSPIERDACLQNPQEMQRNSN